MAKSFWVPTGKKLQDRLLSAVSGLGVFCKEHSDQERFRADMKTLLERVERKNFPDFLESVPPLKLRYWEDNEVHNCYNFAINRQADGGLDPGDLSACEPFDSSLPLREYVEAVRERVRHDGGRSLKESFLECAKGEYPAALFVRPQGFLTDKDYHLFALRKILKEESESKDFDIVWAQKKGLKRGAGVVPRISGISDIFHEAHQEGMRYKCFAGFFAFPASMQDSHLCVPD